MATMIEDKQFTIPRDYTVRLFNQESGYVRHDRNNDIYNGSCAICREGKSWGRKRRSYYLPKKDIIYCHNCGWSSKPYKWIKQVTNMSHQEIMEEVKEYDILPYDFDKPKVEEKRETPRLPKDSINLSDPLQRGYFKRDPLVKQVLDMITQRGLDKAVNRPDKLYTSVRDPVHSGRLVIPFYDIHDKIAWYQSRGISKRDLEQYPKYLSKVDGEKHLFGVNMVNPFSDHVFIFEGPLDCFFVTDSISVAGINEKTDFIMTPKQKEQMEIFNFHEKIWVLDSQYQDKAAYDKTQNLIEMGYNVFIWPEKFGKAFKDFNDIAIRGKRNKIPHKFILDNTCSGLEAEIKLSAIKKPR